MSKHSAAGDRPPVAPSDPRQEDPHADPRLEALEAELAFQGDAVRALNDALGQQQSDLMLLQRQVSLLAQEVRSLRQSQAARQPDAGTSADEKPPHY